MNRILLLTGDLACGKTTFSKILSARYGIEAYNKDTLKEILGDTVGFANREENLRLSRAAVELMTQIFRTAAPLGHDLILEANYHSSEIEEIMVIAKVYDYRILAVNLYADEEVSYKRFCNRIANEHRHPVHQTAGLTTFAAYCEYIERARKEVIPAERIDVDATTFDYQTDETLLGKIDSFFKNN